MWTTRSQSGHHSLISFLNSKWRLNKMEVFLSVSFFQREKGLLENRSLNVFCFFCTRQSAFGPFVCGWKPSLTSTQTSNCGLDCCALKSCSDTGKILTRFFTMEEKTSCLAICQKFTAIKAPSCWCQQVNLWWLVDLGDGQSLALLV